MRLDRSARAAGVGVEPVRPERLPLVLVHRDRKIRHHDHPARTVRHAAQQPRHRGRAVGNPRRADEPRRRRSVPAFRQPPKQPRAPVREIDPTDPREFPRPAIEHDLEQRQRAFPMRRHRLVELDLPQPDRRDILDQQLVERPREIAREPHRFRRIDRLAAARAFLGDHPREDHPPLERLDRGRDRLDRIRRIERRADALVERGIADRDHPRQQQPARARADERVGQRALGAVVGEQHQPARKP